MIGDEPQLFAQIRQLLAAPSSGADAPELADLEHTLTTGYARALALEAERDRLERRRGESGDAERDHLDERLASTAGELSNLRTLLEPLRARASTLRRKETRAARSL